jgi:hypothetical protein
LGAASGLFLFSRILINFMLHVTRYISMSYPHFHNTFGLFLCLILVYLIIIKRNNNWLLYLAWYYVGDPQYCSRRQFLWFFQKKAVSFKFLGCY